MAHVSIDPFSRFVMLKATPTADGENTVDATMETIAVTGVPVRLQHDGARHFDNHNIKLLCKKLGIEDHMTTAYHPQSNGAVERSNRVIVNTIRALIGDLDQDWDVLLPSIQLAMNTAKSAATGLTPFQIMFGREPAFSLGTVRQAEMLFSPQEYAAKVASATKKATEQATKLQQEYFQKMKTHFDRHHKDYSFEEGELVLVYFKTKKNKLSVNWRGPYKIKKVLSKVTLEVEHIVSEKTMKVHVERVKLYDDSLLNSDELLQEASKEDREYTIEEVLEHAWLENHWCFKVSWLGYEASEDSWEPEENLT